jgi:hypothetical protein
MRAGDEQGLVPRALVFVMLELILKSFAEQQGRTQWPGRGRNRNKERSWLRSWQKKVIKKAKKEEKKLKLFPPRGKVPVWRGI